MTGGVGVTSYSGEGIPSPVTAKRALPALERPDHAPHDSANLDAVDIDGIEALVGGLQTEAGRGTGRLAIQSLENTGLKTEDYRVGPGDVLEISIFEWELRDETKTATFSVSESANLGFISSISKRALEFGKISELLWPGKVKKKTG